MTERQKQIVNENINLVEFIVYNMREFTKSNYSLIEECKSVAYETLCNCAIRYEETKGKFETYALSSMKWATWDYIRREFSKGLTFSNNVPACELQKIRWTNILELEQPDSNNNIEFIENMTVLLSMCTQTEKEILSLCLDGKSKVEICEILGISKRKTDKDMLHIKNMMKAVFFNDDSIIGVAK